MRKTMAPVPIKMTAIETVIENAVTPNEFPRPYLGISQLGHSCPRYLWYYFRWVYKEQHSPRILRIFERGVLEEARVIADLIAAGCTITDLQTEIEVGAFIRGHCDGVVHNVPDEPSKPHVLEIKTMKDSSFRLLKKVGSIEKANFGYYCQIITYMFFLGHEWGLFIVTNKDTEERYYERISADDGLAQFLMDKGVDITRQEIPPNKLSESPSWYECKFCSAREVCHYGKDPEFSCRSCEFITTNHSKGEGWYCTKHEMYLTDEDHKVGCAQYHKASALSN